MLLTSFQYSTLGWSLNPIALNPTNLIVGPNSTGKTKACKALAQIINLLTQRDLLESYMTLDSVMHFNDGDDKIEYGFSVKQGRYVAEWMIVNEQTVLSRMGDDAYLLEEPVSPPENKLILQVRRDTVKYPVIEKIVTWAEKAKMLHFSDLEWDGVMNSSGGDEYLRMTPLFPLVASMSRETISNVIEDVRGLGFKIKDVTVVDMDNMIKHVAFEEEGIERTLFEFSLSDGMKRAVTLVMFVHYMASHSNPSILIIDDLGEGLDYDRSKRLGRYVFEKCREMGVQLVVTSNDSFLMNVVDIDNWNILYREGAKVNSINKTNSPVFFENIKFVGLNNFDVFTSGILAKQIESKKSADSKNE